MTRTDLISAMEAVKERRAAKRREKAEAAAFAIGVAMICTAVGHWVSQKWSSFVHDSMERNFAAAAKACGRQLIAREFESSMVTVPGGRQQAAATALRAALRARGLGALQVAEMDHGIHTIFLLRHQTAYKPELQPIADQLVNDSMETERVWQQHLREMERLNRERPNTRQLPKRRVIGTYM